MSERIKAQENTIRAIQLANTMNLAIPCPHTVHISKA